MARSSVEAMGLQYEAERLVRSGESRAEVSRLLGVSVQTLAGWALRGGWRKKDLELELSGKITRRVVANVAAGHAWDRERRALLAQQRELARAAIGLIAAGEGEALARLMAGAPETGMQARPALGVIAVVDEGVEGMRSLGDAPVSGAGVVDEEAWGAEACGAEIGEAEAGEACGDDADDGWDGVVAD